MTKKLSVKSIGALNLVALALCMPAICQSLTIVQDVPIQPLVTQVERLSDALEFVGTPLSEADREQIRKAFAQPSDQAVKTIQKVLDARALLQVEIDKYRRLTVSPAQAGPRRLVKNGWTTYLVKVINRAGDAGPIDVESPHDAPVYDFSRMEVERSIYEDQFTDVMLEQTFHKGVTWGTWGGGYPYKEPPQPEQGDIWPPHGELSRVPTEDRWVAVSLFQQYPMSGHLSGLKVEYLMLQIYSRDAGERTMNISFNVGQLNSSGTGSVDYVPGNPGFRGETELTFNAEKAIPVDLSILDARGKPTAAALIIRDQAGRVYPHRAKRRAPDLFFQEQVYRYDGETVELPAGDYSVKVSKGPQYIEQTKDLVVKPDGEAKFSVRLESWFEPRKHGYTSNDGHVHTAGCLHYNDPTYGITPDNMLRYAVGEDLDIADILIWGPNFYYQREKYFTGTHPHPISTDDNVVTHNMEVSQFPSSAGGHISGHLIKSMNYPGANSFKEWPSYTLPVLEWFQEQGGLAGYTHAGFGLDVQSTELPNYITPPMDSIGANEFIMTVAHGAADFIGIGNTNYISELNIWYHVLNSGFRPMIRGETDWPCINGKAIGRGRSYVPTGDGAVSYKASIDGINKGNSYVSDGRSHLMNFKVNGSLPSREPGDEVSLSDPSRVTVTAQVAAYLPEKPATVKILGEPYPMDTQRTIYVPMPEPKTVRISDLPITGVSWMNIPWWHLERARIGDTRNVSLEVVINGQPVASKTIKADGSLQNVQFDVPVAESSWIAMRILGASHTNPVWVQVANEPVRVKKSIEWSLRALQQCFEIKRQGWRAEEYESARKAYEYAGEIYLKNLHEAGS